MKENLKKYIKENNLKSAVELQKKLIKKESLEGYYNKYLIPLINEFNEEESIKNNFYLNNIKLLIHNNLEVNLETSKKSVVLLSFDEEESLSTLLFMEFFKILGYSVYYLPNKIIKCEVIDFIKEVDPDIVAISIDNAFDIIESNDITKEIMKNKSKYKVVICNNSNLTKRCFTNIKGDLYACSYEDLKEITNERV